MTPRAPSLLAAALLALIGGYRRFLSPVLRALFGPACRFEPSCSQYAAACIQEHGAMRGGLLSMVRVCKCHPFHPGGFDPPPPRRPTTTNDAYMSPQPKSEAERESKALRDARLSSMTL